ncbi:hypothetical protein SAMN05216188_106207 [Lentzea xinjiangensis]|uniref:Uncharacterized protein n=1 Tax=Lentzea xinjiangensis TaxID=402600 RepID=A0A1H9JXQ5_9PSEU|nr:hypothetical protein [Lentzea xinjiangensis]SEQ91751.1 hypothetical protein SAMN05216188_106207 [Lentzea xinjiangensis]
MTSCTGPVVHLRAPMSDDERVSLVERTALCHPAVRGVRCEISFSGEVHAEVVVWRGAGHDRAVRDLAAALGAVLGGVPVRLSVAAVAYRRRGTVLLSMSGAGPAV